MLILGLRNSTTQDLAVGDLINLGTVYRRYDKVSKRCGRFAYSSQSTAIGLQQAGIYHVTAVITFTAPVAGVVTFQLNENEFVIPSAVVSETITTATTETRTVALDFYVLVDSNCVLGSNNAFKSISITNTGVASTVTNVVVNVDKVV